MAHKEKERSLIEEALSASLKKEQERNHNKGKNMRINTSTGSETHLENTTSYEIAIANNGEYEEISKSKKAKLITKEKSGEWNLATYEIPVGSAIKITITRNGITTYGHFEACQNRKPWLIVTSVDSHEPYDNGFLKGNLKWAGTGGKVGGLRIQQGFDWAKEHDKHNQEQTETEEPENLEEWFNENLETHAEDIAKYGADCGFPGITFTDDTVKIFDKYGEDIWNMAAEEAEANGYKNIADMIGKFNRADMLGELDTFKNLMVWAACEILANRATKN